AIREGSSAPRQDYLFFASETPYKGHYNLTAFNDDWKLVQEMVHGLSSVEVTNYLFRIQDDPYEYNNLAQQYPQVVAELAEEIHHWRSLHPASGTRAELMPPPGWRAPKDWADYPRPLDQLQQDLAPGMPPSGTLIPLDWQYGENGRLIYNCEPYRWLGGGLCR
ncbi:MAG: arylsulfatase, partial [Halieaceae bacterium]